MPSHTVEQGDCFNSLAVKYGFFNYQTIYKFGQNANNWKNPNMLEEGKTVEIPDKQPKKLPLQLDQETIFVVDPKKTRLRVAVVDVEGEAPKVSKCQLMVGLEGASRLGAKGLTELEIDGDDKVGTLTIDFPALPKVDTGKTGKKPAVAANKALPHPPEIAPMDFEDELEKEVEKPEAVEVELKLLIGFLEPPTVIRGGLERLNNLGCKVPDPTAKTADDDETKAVVKSYQLSMGKKDPPGKIADILNDLQAAHDNI